MPLPFGARRITPLPLPPGLPGPMNSKLPRSQGRSPPRPVIGAIDQEWLELRRGDPVEALRSASLRPLSILRQPGSCQHTNDFGAGAVLLANNDAVLPRAGPIAVIGEFARTPRYQGAGSSHINLTRLDDALSAILGRTRREVVFAPRVPPRGRSTLCALEQDDPGNESPSGAVSMVNCTNRASGLLYWDGFATELLMANRPDAPGVSDPACATSIARSDAVSRFP